MKAREFPVGNPHILTREQISLQNPFPWRLAVQNPYRGLLLCRVLPPQHLRIPLLPYRTLDERLTFPLCAKCANKCQQHLCQHQERERAWTAAYTHVELNRALELGYVVLDVHEVGVNFFLFY